MCPSLIYSLCSLDFVYHVVFFFPPLTHMTCLVPSQSESLSSIFPTFLPTSPNFYPVWERFGLITQRRRVPLRDVAVSKLNFSTSRSCMDRFDRPEKPKPTLKRDFSKSDPNQTICSLKQPRTTRHKQRHPSHEGCDGVGAQGQIVCTCRRLWSSTMVLTGADSWHGNNSNSVWKYAKGKQHIVASSVASFATCRKLALWLHTTVRNSSRASSAPCI